MPDNLFLSARAKSFVEDILDMESRYQAIFTGENKEDDPDSLLDDIRISAVELARELDEYGS